MIRVLLLVWLTLLAACSSPPPPPRPAAEEGALRWSQRGEEAYRRGEWREAQLAFEEAHRAFTSLDRVEGAAQQSLNVAAASYRAGEVGAARTALDRVLEAPASPALHAEAAYRRALIELDEGARAEAARWMERSLALCGDPTCMVAGPVANLRARLEFAEGRLDAAAAEAQRALELSRRREQRVEQANALRLLGDVALARDNAALAQTQYTQALELDRAAGESRRIALDLLGLARALAAQGQQDAARQHARRAGEVARSIGAEELVQQAEAMLARSGAR